MRIHIRFRKKNCTIGTDISPEKLFVDHSFQYLHTKCGRIELILISFKIVNDESARNSSGVAGFFPFLEELGVKLYKLFCYLRQSCHLAM